MGKAQQQKETPQQKALADVGRQVIADFQRRWAPVIQSNAKQIVAAGLSDSRERRRADTMAKLDTNVAFAGAQDKIDAQAAAAGDFGSSRHKLATTGLNTDQATSSGLAAVGADQVADDALVSGLGAVSALGRGQRAQAIQGLSTVASMSGQKGQSDAQIALQRRMGDAQLVGQAVGLGAGYALGEPAQTPTMFENSAASLPDQLPNEARRLGLPYPG